MEYFATILFEDHDGKLHTIRALIYAVDQADAIQGAIDAVSSLPHCAEVLGGMLEVPSDERSAEQAPTREQYEQQQRERPAQPSANARETEWPMALGSNAIN